MIGANYACYVKPAGITLCSTAAQRALLAHTLCKLSKIKQVGGICTTALLSTCKSVKQHTGVVNASYVVSHGLQQLIPVSADGQEEVASQAKKKKRPGGRTHSQVKVDKERLMTSTEAAATNEKLPKGFMYVPAHRLNSGTISGNE